MALAMKAACGTWESPITTDLISKEVVTFLDMQADEKALYWTELHPTEKGRMALVRYTPEEGEKPLLKEYSVRSRVHEYGGGSFCLYKGSVIFSNDQDYQLYSLDGTNIKPLTFTPDCRYADGSGLIWVGEKEGKENYLVSLKEGKTIASGHDFYSSPRVSPDGKKLAYITWDFPYMQWDSSTLWVADIGEDGQIKNSRMIAGGPDESICQVQWSKDNVLHFVSDKTGFWNLYRLRKDKVEPLCEMEAEFGNPAWVFGRPTYAFLDNGKIVCLYVIRGVDHLGLLDPEKKSLKDLGLPFTMIQSIVALQGKVYFFGASPTLPPSLICYDPHHNQYKVIKQSFASSMGAEWISQGENIEYASADGKKGYAFYYPPKNPHFQPLEGERPPLIVKCHGGPTSRSYSYLELSIQYWTSRGFAVVDVNYGGSTGYGREYFKRLEGNWGILDVEDSIAAAQSLVAKGLADRHRLFIRGGSAGGYTTLCALTSHAVFAGGTSYFGVSDLELLYMDSHKFEAKYTDRLVAPYPERVDLIRERSPIHHIDKISAPVLLLQGEEDKVVPPNQAFTIYDQLKAKGTPVGMILFEGEGHGFRRGPNIKRALDAELYFYAKILKLQLTPPFAEPPVEIFNLK